MKLFHQDLAYFAVVYVNKTQQFTVLTVNAGVITNDNSPECIVLYNTQYMMHTRGTMYGKPCYKGGFHTLSLGDAYMLH